MENVINIISFQDVKDIDRKRHTLRIIQQQKQLYFFYNLSKNQIQFDRFKTGNITVSIGVLLEIFSPQKNVVRADALNEKEIFD